MSSNWSGNDLLVRALRAVAAILLMLLLAWVVIQSPSESIVLGTLVGALLVVLGFADWKWPGK